jgi:hypothetical protein
MVERVNTNSLHLAKSRLLRVARLGCWNSNRYRDLRTVT